MNGFDESLSLDCTQTWNNISDHVYKDIMPAINSALRGRVVRYSNTELKNVLQQYHRHQRESYRISQDEDLANADRKRKGINSRRFEVSIFFKDISVLLKGL